MATRKDQKLKTKPKSRQGMSRPATEAPFGKQATAKQVARAVNPRRTNAPRATGVVAALIAERSERDDELFEQIARSFEWRRRSKAHVENDLGGVRSEKRVRITVTLEEDLIEIAEAFTGITDKSALIQIALTGLVTWEAARRLAATGGTMPESKEMPRGRLPGK